MASIFCFALSYEYECELFNLTSPGPHLSFSSRTFTILSFGNRTFDLWPLQTFDLFKNWEPFNLTSQGPPLSLLSRVFATLNFGYRTFDLWPLSLTFDLFVSQLYYVRPWRFISHHYVVVAWLLRPLRLHAELFNRINPPKKALRSK